jgi:hypothetical protein
VCYDQATGSVRCAAVSEKADAAINISYLAVALRVLKDYGREAQFSLDPSDPHDISGEQQVKKFYPPFLAGTVVGEVLFQADYALKEVCMGDLSLPGIPNVFDDWLGNEPTAARQWFVLKDASVVVSADGALLPRCKMGVEARRLVPSDKGFVDAPHTDPKEPMVQVANAITERFDEVAVHIPCVGELVAVAKAMVVARFLLERGCRRNEVIVDAFDVPSCPEGEAYTMQIPTLKKVRRTVNVVESADGLSMEKKQRSMHGGVDLGMPAKRVPATASKEKLLAKEAVQTQLPLFARMMGA